jgi:hypothetical protein
MLSILMLRSALWTLATVLGGFGVFCAIGSFYVPAAGSYAVVMIGAALGINYFLNR